MHDRWKHADVVAELDYRVAILGRNRRAKERILSEDSNAWLLAEACREHQRRGLAAKLANR